MPREKSCGTVVFKKNGEVEYLLLHYGTRHWDFPKGNVEQNEREKDTALRELTEETGISNAKFVGDFREVINYSYRRRGVTISKEVVYFLVCVEATKVELSYEHSGYEWLNYEQAIKKLTFENSKTVLRKAHAFWSAHSRQHARAFHE
jgi:bis(5'-nucleosidyl)-tetraphosphatase